MPYTLKARQISVKDPDTGSYVGLDILTEQTARSVINEVTVLADAKKNEVTQEATSQFSAITSLGDSKKQAITNEAAARMTEITNEKNAITTLADTRKQEIIAEGNTQKAEVNRKGMEVLATIPDDYTSMSYMVDHMSNGGFIYSTASGEIAEFDDGADDMVIKNLKATFEPKQDYNGYEKPWPAYGDINLFPPIKSVMTNNGVSLTQNDDGSITLNGSANDTQSAMFIFPLPTPIPADSNLVFSLNNQSENNEVGIRLLSTTAISSETNYGTSIFLDIPNKRDMILHTTFECKSINLFVKTGHGEVDITLKPMVHIGNTYLDYRPCENVCPIIGYTGLNGRRTGKSILKYYTSGSSTINGVEWTFSDGVVHASCDGTSYDTAGEVTIILWINNPTIDPQYNRTLPPGNYYFYSGITDGAQGEYDMFIYDVTTNSRAMQWDGKTFVKSAIRDQLYQVQILEGHFYSLVCRVRNNTVFQDRKFYPMICMQDEIEASFEPYREQIISVNWETSEGTIHGGSVDIATGKLKINTIEYIVNGSWVSDRATMTVMNNVIRIWLYKDSTVDFVSTVASAKCDRYVYNATYNDDIPSWLSGGTQYPRNAVLKIPKGVCEATQAGIRAYLNANPVQFVLPLAKPIERQLTPQQITTLIGKNNIWIDDATISVTYPVDTKTYIDRKIKEKVNEMLGA